MSCIFPTQLVLVQDPEAYLIVMGFPCSVSERHTAFCACHQEVKPTAVRCSPLTAGDAQVKGAGYLCPRCLSKMCEATFVLWLMPVVALICGPSPGQTSHSILLNSAACGRCELPSQCKVCGLSLMSSSHLARSYHHLFPVTIQHQLRT